MNRYSDQDIARKLASLETPEPPADLLERLYHDLPESFPGTGEAPPVTNPPAGTRRWWSPRWLAVAAMLLMVVGGGFLAFRVQERMVRSDMGFEVADADAQSLEKAASAPEPTVPDASRGMAAAAPSEGLKQELADGLEQIQESVANEAGAPVAMNAPPPALAPAPAPAAPPPAAVAKKVPGEQETSSLGPRSRSSSYALEPEQARRQAEAGSGTFSVGIQAEPLDRIVGPEPSAVGDETPAEERSQPYLAEARPSPAPARKVAPVSGARAEAAPEKPKVASPSPAAPDTAGRFEDAGADVDHQLESDKMLDRREVVVRREAPVVAPVVAPPSPPPSTGGTAEPNGQAYGDVFFDSAGTNPFIDTEDDPFSTFGLDVDTASYTVVRRYLRDGHLPPASAVRVEEMVNYFSYGDAPPRRGDFALYAEGGPAIFAQSPRYRLLRFHLQARHLAAAERRPSVLMLVVDVSGSMSREDRLATVRRSLALLVDRLEPGDRVGLVSFGSEARLLVEPTGDRERLRRAIERLVPDGSTNAEAGLVLAYETLAHYQRPGVLRRVILCSDGVANVGATDAEQILERVRREAEGGIELTTVGFGMGNYNDVLMERLADQGDGRYAYVDDLREARRVFVEELTGTLETVASDARVQVRFDRQMVERYRLLGYENRDMADELFRDDTADAGEIGAGHGVTALYEVKLARGVERLDEAHLATLHLRYRSTATGHFEEQAVPIGVEDLALSWQEESRALRLSTLVAEFAEILRGSYWAKNGDLREVFRRAQQVSAEFPGDTKVAELAALIGRAAELAEEGKRGGE